MSERIHIEIKNRSIVQTSKAIATCFQQALTPLEPKPAKLLKTGVLASWIWKASEISEPRSEWL